MIASNTPQGILLLGDSPNHSELDNLLEVEQVFLRGSPVKYESYSHRVLKYIAKLTIRDRVYPEGQSRTVDILFVPIDKIHRDIKSVFNILLKSEATKYTLRIKFL